MISSKTARLVLTIVSMMSVMLVPTTAFSQTSTLGRITGVASDSSSKPLDEVFITLKQAGTNVERSTFVAHTGSFRFDALMPGEYSLRVERVGFSPLVITNIPVRANQAVQIRPMLSPAAAGAERVIETDFAGTALSRGRPAEGDWIDGRLAHALPFWTDNVGSLLRLSSRSSVSGDAEGLPAFMSSTAVDAFPFRSVLHPFIPQAADAFNAVSLTGVRAASLIGGRADVEWDGGPGLVLSAYSLAGSNTANGNADATWSSNVFSKPGSFDAGSLSFNDIRGAFTLSGPALADSARFSLGFSARHSEIPVAPVLDPDVFAGEAVTAAGDALGKSLTSLLQPSIASDNAASGFGHLEWRVSGKHTLEATVRGGSVSASRFVGANLVASPEATGSDVLAGASLRSLIGGGGMNSLQLSITGSRIQTDASTIFSPTVFAAERIAFGTEQAASSAEENAVRVFDAFEQQAGHHRIKIGGELNFNSFDYTYRPGTAGQLVLGSAADATTGGGFFTRTSGPVTTQSWTAPTTAVFAQDAWTSGTGLSVTVGMRADREKLDAPGVAVDVQYRALTSVSNDVAPVSEWRLSPRLGVSWDVKDRHQWLIDAAATVVQGRIDPRVVNQWMVDDGTATVVRSAGTLVGFPDRDPDATTTSRRLTLFAPDFRAPQTTRVSAGLTHTIAKDAVVLLSGVYRDTRYLPRSVDLNQFQGALFHDQFGRAIYGQLQQHAGALGVTPGTNRRFSTYDEVAALQSDAHARYYGATIGLDRAMGTKLSAHLRYTLSRAEDNWVNATAGVGASAPADLAASGDWAQGTSDFDRPSRGVAAVAYEFSPGMSVSALFRRESGMPFTPGFGAGVDANGDGNTTNDPAFISTNVGGTDELASQWSCLRTNMQQYAARNACRGSATNSLDLRFAGVLSHGRVAPGVTIEVFDALASESGIPDSALYLVDATGSLDVSGGTVTVPLVANPNFGKPVAHSSLGRRIRIGLSLNW